MKKRTLVVTLIFVLYFGTGIFLWWKGAGWIEGITLFENLFTFFYVTIFWLFVICAHLLFSFFQ